MMVLFASVVDFAYQSMPNSDFVSISLLDVFVGTLSSAQ
jgi:hypothetical protein